MRKITVHTGLDRQLDFEPKKKFLNLLHRLKIIKIVAFNPGYFMADAALTIDDALDCNYARLVYEPIRRRNS